MKAGHIGQLRLQAQGLAEPRHASPAAVVRWLGAVQAQDYLGALWAVGARLRSATEASVERALAERSVVRTWPLRGTLHFVAADDVHWLRDLLAGRTLGGAKGRLAQLDIDGKVLVRAEATVVRGLEGGQQRTRAELYASLARAGVSTAGQRGIHLLWSLAHQGVLCFGPRQGKQHTFVLLDEWLPRRAGPSGDEALAQLASRYFRGHGPATAHDFAWWAGLTLGLANTAIQAAGSALQSADVEGRAHWFSAELDRSALPRGTWLLPAFDEFVVAFKDRRASVSASDIFKVNPGAAGILHPTVVTNGRLEGTWKRTLSRRGVTTSVSYFRPASATQRALRQATERYAEFLGVPLVR